MKVIDEKVVPFSEAKELLEKRKKDTELGYEQQNTLEYLEKFTKLSDSESNKLRKELEELNLLSEKQIMELINVLPSKEEQVKAVLSKEKLEFSADKVKEIAKIVKKFAK